ANGDDTRRAPVPTDRATIARHRAARERLDSDGFAPFVESLELLGRRTAQMHLALADSSEPALVPERFTAMSQRSLYQGVRSQVRAGLSQLRRARTSLGEQDRSTVEELIGRGDDLIALLEP